MLKNIIPLIILLFACVQIKAQGILKSDTTHLVKEVVVTYQADKLTPITFQNISGKDFKAKSTGQSLLICFRRHLQLPFILMQGARRVILISGCGVLTKPGSIYHWTVSR